MKHTKTSRILSVLLALCMILGMMPVTALAADAETVTITYELNGGTPGPDFPENGKETYEKGERIFMSMPSAEWAVPPEGMKTDGYIWNDQHYRRGEFITLTEDITITLMWRPDVPEIDRIEANIVGVEEGNTPKDLSVVLPAGAHYTAEIDYVEVALGHQTLGPDDTFVSGTQYWINLNFTLTDGYIAAPSVYTDIGEMGTNGDIIDSTHVNSFGQVTAPAAGKVAVEVNLGQASRTPGPEFPQYGTTQVDKGTVLNLTEPDPRYVIAPENTEFNYYMINGEEFHVGSTYTCTGNTYIVLHWTDIVTVTYDANGGTKGPDFVESKKFIKGNSFTIVHPAETFLKAPEGKEFDAVEINGIRYEANQTYTFDNNVTIKYLWKDAVHTHSAELVAGQAATCAADGWKDYYKCDCGKFFEDEACTKEITNLNTWKNGDGKLAKLPHSFGEWTVVTPATETEEGLEKRVCSVCGHEETRAIPVTPPVISQATVTFRVVNGTWDGIDSVDKTVTVTLTDGKGTLTAAQVPTGMEPAEGYEGGAWDVTPVTTENGIAGDVTYTYSFTEKAGLTPITEVSLIGLTKPVYGAHPDYELSVPKDAPYHFASKDEIINMGANESDKAINGLWWRDIDDNFVAPTDTFTQTGEFAYRLHMVLVANEGYEFVSPTIIIDGDVAVISDMAIRGSAMYAVVPHDITPPAETKATVTFKVENGTWSDDTAEDKTVEVTLMNGQGTLTAAKVPTGMKPAEGYEGGAWDVTPVTTKDGITGNVTYTYTFAPVHIHQPVLVPGQAPTCTADGWKNFYKCDCGKFFEDEACTKEIPNVEAWKTGDGKLTKLPHSFEWIIDKEATETTAGAKHQHCTVCGYNGPSVEIPAKGGSTPVDPEKPNKPVEPAKPGISDKAPQTGDSRNLMLWALLSVTSLGGAAAVLTLNKKKKFSTK